MSTPAGTELSNIDYLQKGIEIINASNHEEIRIWLEKEQASGRLSNIDNSVNPFSNPSFRKLNLKEKKQFKDLLENYKELRNVYISTNRAYIPQGHLGICPAGSSNILSIRLLSTHGIGPCVGVTLYSRDMGLAVLAHIDDEFKATAWDLKGDTKIKAQNEATEHYVSYIRKIMGIIGNPEDVVVNLIHTLDKASPQLKNIIKNACLRNHIPEQSINDNVFEPLYDTDSCVLFLNDGKVIRYEEKKQFESGKTIKKTLNLPEELRFFYLEKGQLKEVDATSDYILLPSGYITHDPSDFIDNNEIKLDQENIQIEDKKKDKEAEFTEISPQIAANNQTNLVNTLSNAETALNLPSQEEIKLHALMHGITARSLPDSSNLSLTSISTPAPRIHQENEIRSKQSNVNASPQITDNEAKPTSQTLQERFNTVRQDANELKQASKDIQIANKPQQMDANRQIPSSSNRSLNFSRNRDAQSSSTEKHYQEPTESSNAKKRDKYESNEPKPPWKPPGPGRYKP